MTEGAAGGEDRPAPRGLLTPRRKLALGLAFLAALVAFAWTSLDWATIGSVLARADLGALALGAVLSVASLACWSEALRRLLPPGAAPVDGRRGFLVYATGALVRNAIPLGYASSIGVLAYVYRREAALPLDRALAAVSVAEFLNAVASTGVAVAGALLLLALGPATPLAWWLAAGGVVVVVGGSAAATLLWYRREGVERVLHAAAARLARVVEAIADRPAPIAPEAVEAAIGGYYESLATVSEERRAVGVALTLSVAAWLGLVGALLACGQAVGYAVPLPVALLVVPVAGYATILPVPGGLGGYELGLVGVLAALGNAEVVVAVAVTLLFRLCSYWLTIALGAVASAALSVDLRDLASAAANGPLSPES